jgi:hypothetical protein
MRPTASERGQVIVVFAFALVAIVMMLALLFDGARGLVMRRELRNASDAAAMAGANILESITPNGCSSDPTADPAVPQATVVTAVHLSVAANLPDYDPADIDITCPPGYGNSVVRVQLGAESPTFFGSIFGNGPLLVGSTSAAINGEDGSNQYSVILLNDSNLGWPQQRRGCPSFLLSGGPTVIFDSSIYIDSDCTRANGGALSTNGNATTLQLGNSGPRIRMVGEYAPQALTITPAPVEGAPSRPDPLYFTLYPNDIAPDDNEPPGTHNTPAFTSTTSVLSTASLKVRKTNKYIIGQGQSSQTVVLYPGVYKGGIELRNNSVALLEPGVYVLQGGGLKLGAQTSLYAVDAGVSTTPAVWGTACNDGSCGVMIYNAGDASGSGAMGDITIAAGATFKVRSYDSAATSPSSILNDAAGTHFSDPTYDHMLIWQSKNPAASNTYAQPVIHLNGGGNVEMTGTIYAPRAKVLMGGTSGGSGGSAITLTLQFIVWDLEISGNATFHFVYDGREFVVPPDYGLIE